MDVQDKNTIRFFERYEDEGAFKDHTQTTLFQAYEARLPDLLTGQPGVHRFDVSEASELKVEVAGGDRETAKGPSGH